AHLLPYTTLFRSAGPAHRVESAVRITRLQVDGGDGVAKDEGVEPEPARVQHGLLHAVVRRQAGDDDPLDAALSKDPLQRRGLLLAGLGVAHSEHGVSVLASRPLLQVFGAGRIEQVGMERSAPRAADAVHRPDPAVLLEVRRGYRMRVGRVDDERTGPPRLANRRVHDLDDVLAAPDVQR